MKNLTAQSAKVLEAICTIIESEGGIGASLQDIQEETGIETTSLRGNLSDLIQKELIFIDEAKHSGAAFDLYYETTQWS